MLYGLTKCIVTDIGEENDFATEALSSPAMTGLSIHYIAVYAI